MTATDLIQVRRGTAAAWAAANPILSDGEPGWADDTKQLRIGDGTLAWLSLPVLGAAGAAGATGPAGPTGPTAASTVVVGGSVSTSQTVNCTGIPDLLYTITLTGSLTVTFTNLALGQAITMEVTQDATGSRVLTVSPTPKTPGGTGLALSTSALALDVITLWSPDRIALHGTIAKTFA